MKILVTPTSMQPGKNETALSPLREFADELVFNETGRPLTEEELAKCEAIRRELGSSFCRRCGYCAPCTVGINIPSLFTLVNYLRKYDLSGWAKSRYDATAVRADACVECGLCESRCPYQLPIREMLKAAHKDLMG